MGISHVCSIFVLNLMVEKQNLSSYSSTDLKLPNATECWKKQEWNRFYVFNSSTWLL